MGMTMKNPILLEESDVVAVCDGEKFILLRNDGTRAEPCLSVEIERRERHPAARAIGADRPRRVANPAGGPRSATDGADLHDEAESRFLAGVLADLERGIVEGGYRNIVLVAPPRAMGRLRRNLPRELDEHIKAEVVADLVDLPIAEIQARFRPNR